MEPRSADSGLPHRFYPHFLQRKPIGFWLGFVVPRALGCYDYLERDANAFGGDLTEFFGAVCDHSQRNVRTMERAQRILHFRPSF